MTASDLQSGMGLGGRDSDEGEEQTISAPRERYVVQEEVKTLYDTKAEQRKREMKSNAEQPLNSLCNCGSNKKYKNCCLKKIA
jgi:uncharacterized protein YchJ